MLHYSIRRLYLNTEEDISAELAKSHAHRVEEFKTLYRRYRWVLKVICHKKDFSAQLLSSLSLRGIACWLVTPRVAWIFADDHILQEIDTSLLAWEADFTEAVKKFLNNYQQKKRALSFGSHSLALDQSTLIMGILNCTPDSFYDGGRYFSHKKAIEHGIRMAEDGADIIDVGGESTRPKGPYGKGAKPVTTDEEIQRVIPVIEGLKKATDIPISIDTYKASVAEAAIQAGATMINDISGFLFDKKMPEVAARYQIPVVIMHIKGSPQNMQQDPTYENLIDEIYLHLETQIEKAVQAGLARDFIILDPGIGFGKSIDDNYKLIRRLKELQALGCPILIGVSRKSFIGNILNLPPEQRLYGTAAASAIAVMNGAHILRSHDVKEMRQVVCIADLIAGQRE